MPHTQLWEDIRCTVLIDPYMQQIDTKATHNPSQPYSEKGGLQYSSIALYSISISHYDSTSPRIS